MNNINISLSHNQEKNKIFEHLILWMQHNLIESSDLEPIKIDHRFTKNCKQILSIIIRYCGVFHSNYISHNRIAELSGVHHDTVLRILHMFEELKILKIQNRGPNTTCIYELGSFLHDKEVIWQLKDIFPNLYWAIQSIIRRCKTMVESIMQTFTARLLNNKNKNNITIQPIHTKPEPIERRIVYLEPDIQTHNKYFNEFAAILNISTP